MIPSPGQDAVLTALRAFLLEVLPAGTAVVAAQGNRVPEPAAPNFVVMTPTELLRLRTNVDSSADVRFVGSLAGTVLTVTSVFFGAIEPGATVFGVGVAAGTRIASQSSGSPGGVGVYVATVAQTLPSRVLSSGAKTVERGTEVVVQLDFHSADLAAAADMAQVVSTLTRDSFAVERMDGTGVVPLHADDPRQVPFVNEAQQWEWRWIVEAHLQVNPVVSVPQQYADSVAVELASVDAIYPP